MELTAKPIPKRRRINGAALESDLDFIAVLALVLGGLALLGIPMFHGVAGFLYFCSVVIGSFLTWLLLRTLAELIRLQKRIAGMDYAGRISGPYYDTVSTCGNCGAMLYSDVCCDGCGARLLKPDADGPTQDDR
ncbi:hypothetical protein SH528x_001079 [Novipirellula sp. SH528]|uniref:hypothetical protein n=1 Tax=Novipirellula sp. SH528 TaxID=3454466 RepID=UPI003FA0164E